MTSSSDLKGCIMDSVKLFNIGWRGIWGPNGSTPLHISLLPFPDLSSHSSAGLYRVRVASGLAWGRQRCAETDRPVLLTLVDRG